MVATSILSYLHNILGKSYWAYVGFGDGLDYRVDATLQQDFGKNGIQNGMRPWCKQHYFVVFKYSDLVSSLRETEVAWNLLKVQFYCLA